MMVRRILYRRNLQPSSADSPCWRLMWTSPAGAAVKRFDFGGSLATGVFTLHEHCSERFQFDYRWTNNAVRQDFVFEKGADTADALREEKSLNQYTAITVQGESAFQPIFDLDGNQTLVKTSTGIWQVTYNGENRQVQWTCGTTNLMMKYDRMGRRVEYVEHVDENIRKHQRFVYNGYLCIQCYEVRPIW